MGYNIEKIIALNPLSVWLERYGIEVDRKGFARCPFHSEKTASFRVYPNDKFYCFGCGAHGSVIDLVRRMENLDFSGACERLDGDISYSEQRRIDRIKRQRLKAKDDRDKTNKAYWKAFDEYWANQQIIKEFAPADPTAEQSKIWAEALNHQSGLLYALELAELSYMRGGINGG